MYAPNVRVGPEGWRPAPDAGRLSVLAPPGTYAVKLSVGGRELTQPLTVRKDPNSEGTEADIQAQIKVLFEGSSPICVQGSDGETARGSA